jgi:hypothetical protein
VARALKFVRAKAKDSFGPTSPLVRPDGFVARATQDKPDMTRVAEAIKYWLGPEAKN